MPTSEEDRKIMWASADDNIAQITNEGIVEAMSPGDTEVTVMVGEVVTKCAIRVKKKDINELKFMDINDQIYTGNEIKVEPNIVSKIKELERDKDYKATYVGDCINAGTVTICVEGINNYCGERKISYKIVKKEIINPTAAPSETPKADTSAKPTVVPSETPKADTSVKPTVVPSETPKVDTSAKPTVVPSEIPRPNVDNSSTIVPNEGVTELGAVEDATGMMIGTLVVDDVTNGVYKVISATEVQYKKMVSNKAISIVPSTVTLNGKKYKVISIADKAFANNKMLKKIIITANIERIGKKAFYNCKNLKTVIIKTKSLRQSSVGIKAFKGINAKAKIIVPQRKKKYYRNILIKSGVKKKAKFK